MSFRKVPANENSEPYAEYGRHSPDLDREGECPCPSCSPPARPADCGRAVYLLLQRIGKHQSVVSVHATRESAEQHRHDGDVIQKWAVRQSDG